MCPILSKSKARRAVTWLEREEGDLDLRRERRGGLGGGRGGEDGEMGGLEVVLLLGILKAPPPLSLPLCTSLSLPEEEEAAFKRKQDMEEKWPSSHCHCKHSRKHSENSEKKQNATSFSEKVCSRGGETGLGG